MATFTVTHAQRVDGIAMFQTLETTDITIGQTIVVTSVGDGFDGTFIVQAVPIYYLVGVGAQGDYEYDYDITIVNQLLVINAGDNFNRDTAPGTITWTQSCTWLSSIAPVEEFLGIESATANDIAFLGTCVDAANAWCFRRRVSAGYHDDLTTVPDGSVLLGTVLYAAGLYRERGTTGDSYASFGDMSGPPLMTLGRVNQLLGVKRSQVA